ncbi:TonB-dependent siderophore receptor [Pantoea sp. BAV 3049]|uniref:TonB-dependent receptor plug domain-containing protein n=1 Tax=Pantoea sp. BAV 3049 TaxID=2654188 RepID=UPI00131C3B1F|nr:TonB-dependent receptor [Pantoea sp. BAV 3049]
MEIRPLTLSLAATLAITGQLQAEEQTLQVWSSPIAASRDILTLDTFNQLEKHDAAEALATVSGVTLDKSGNRNEMLVRVRGFDSKQVPIYYDGVPIYIPYDGNLDLSRFLTSGLASLEVSKGYTSLLQGPNQLGGSINLTTQQPKKPLEGRIGYRQGWSRGERNARDMDASLGMKADSGFLQLNGSQLKRDFTGLAHGVTNPIVGENGKRSNSASEDKRGMVKLGWTPRESDEYLFSWIGQQGKKNSPPYAGTAAVQPRYWQWPEYDKQSLYYQGITALGGDFTLKSRIYHDTFKNTLLMYNSAAALRNKQGNYSHYDDYSNGASLQLAANVRDSDLLSFATHWKDDVHREQGSKNGPVDRYADRTWSLATEYQWAVADALDAVAGISYDWRQSLEGLKHESNGTLTRYDGNRQHAFNWQMLMKYHFMGGDTLSFSLADRTRFPTQKERYTTSRPAYAVSALVNPHLQPERAQSVDMSWNGALSELWRYEISAYYNHLSNTILSHDIDAQTVQNRNSGEVNYRGLDFGLNGAMGKKAKVGLNYGLIHSEVKQRSAGKITGLPRQTLTTWVTFNWLENWSMTLTEEARSASYSDNAGTRKAAGYAISHLRTDLQLGKGFSVNAAVQNLFDKEYALTEGFDESGRQFWAGLEYRF